MKNRDPFSAGYYLKENKIRACICILMMFFAALMFLAGNYIHSVVASFEEEFRISDKLVRASLQATDEDFQDWAVFREAVMNDPELEAVDVTAYGLSGLNHKTVLGLEVGGTSYAFSTKEDMEKVFNHLGIQGDLSGCKKDSIVLDEKFAKNLGLKLGDTLDHTYDAGFDQTYTVDAIVKGGGYCVYYLLDSTENLGRLYIYSDHLSDQGLREHVLQLADGLQVKIVDHARDSIVPQFRMFYVLFILMDGLIAIVLAVTINSVVTGQYLKRTYEFGIYRAIGISKGAIWRKVAKEILLTNLIGNGAGLVVILLGSFLLNELVYCEKGMELVYGSSLGIAGFVLCDVLIVLPLIISKGIQMGKADVTQF